MNSIISIAVIMAFVSQGVRSSIPRSVTAAAFTPHRHAAARTRRVGADVFRRASVFALDDRTSSFASSSANDWYRPVSTCAFAPVSLCGRTRLYSTTPSDEVATSVEEIDPYSDRARNDLANFYQRHGIETDDIDAVHKSLLRLTEQVLSWNQRLNLVSRKDCTASVVYHRHILPSIALLPLVLEGKKNDDAVLKVVDVGTGGGFPGLPLALLLPNVQFTLVDSIQKKLVAVSEMAAELDMGNVRVHCGRVEEMYADSKGKREHRGKYDVVLGRSVTALPRFCAWISDLLKRGKDDAEDEGRLIYIIGGDLDELVESRIVQDMPVDQLLGRQEGSSDKRGLIFSARDVETIATESGEKQKIVRTGPGRRRKNSNSNSGGGGGSGGKKTAKGEWSKKRNDVKKDRGYDDFQRYSF